MNIKILHLVEGAKNARGITVIIDVFRAFSLACYMVDKGAERIIPVADIQTAYRLRAENPDYLLAGERNNMKPEGFDFGNSPYRIREYDFTGKTIVHTTSAGTKGIVNADAADEILTGSFVNAGAVIRYIKRKNPSEISLVCMGYAAAHPVEEDNLCAEFIQNALENRSSDFPDMVETIRHTSGRRFFVEDMQEHCPSEDFNLCLDLNRFQFVLRTEKRSGGLLSLTRYNI